MGGGASPRLHLWQVTENLKTIEERRPYALWGGGAGRGGGGRFAGRLAADAAALNRSLPIDRRLWVEELEVDAAWTQALAEAGALAAGEAEMILRGLEQVGERIGAGVAEEADDEDIHTLVERLLVDEIGELAGKLRTGLSRNDQVATLARLWCMRAVDVLVADVAQLERALLECAQSTLDVIIPSYTHLQRAQPVRMAHFFLSHFWPLERDRSRLTDLKVRASVLPLGAGAIAGSGIHVDRESLRERLGFAAIAPNSMDAVSDRDFVAEFASVGALTGAHLSRLGEDLILFSTSEFGFVRFSDSYSTGSSLMPQKRNPDIAELARGKSAGLLAAATSALALLKSLPTGYNKDLQEDKPILFGVFDTLHQLLPPFAGAIATLEVKPDAAAAALDPSLLAVDVADALARLGVTFRDAHAVVGELVRLAEESGHTILQIDEAAAVKLHPSLPAALALIGGGDGPAPYETSVEARSLVGGTGRAAVLDQIAAAKSALSR